MPVGRVTKWVSQSAYGFILPHSGDDRKIFVHISDITDKRALEPGDEVRFERAEDSRGRPKAVQVERL